MIKVNSILFRMVIFIDKYMFKINECLIDIINDIQLVKYN